MPSHKTEVLSLIGNYSYLTEQTLCSQSYKQQAHYHQVTAYIMKVRLYILKYCIHHSHVILIFLVGFRAKKKSCEMITIVVGSLLPVVISQRQLLQQCVCSIFVC